MQKLVLLGDEAIGQAAIDAGLSAIYAYPGTPSTRLTNMLWHRRKPKRKNCSELDSQRKNCSRIGFRRIIFRKTKYGMHETCRFKRSRRCFHQFGNYGCEWRHDSRFGRRSIYA
jgi:hypothetical protein